MTTLNLPANLRDKIYQVNQNSQNNLSKIVSYFPLSADEKQQIITLNNLDSVIFHSVFSDHISEKEWNATKAQITKRFHDELFDID